MADAAARDQPVAVKCVAGTLEEWCDYNKGGTPISGLDERRSLELFLEAQKDLNVFMETLTARIALEAMTPPKLSK